MVQTRSQAAKQKQQRSPESSSPNPVERKKGVTLQPLAASKLNIVVPEGMGQRASKPGKAQDFPLSHPVALSVPPSPAGGPDQNAGAAPFQPAAAVFAAAAAQLAEQAQPPAVPPAAPPAGEKLLPKPHERRLGPGEKMPDGPEPAAVDVEYPPREELQPLDDPAAALEACLAGLESADWVEAVRALNTLRQLAVHHPAAAQPELERLIGGVLKGVRNLRSSLCKTAIMTVADLYVSYGDALLPLTDVGGQAKPLGSVLAQVLLKASSNYKKFVIEEAQRALQTMAESLTPEQFLALLTPYIELHKNPKVRGRAGGAAAAAVARMQPLEMVGVGMPRLLQLAGRLLTDNTPEAREAAKRMVLLLSAAFADEAMQLQLDVQVPEPEPAAEGEAPPPKPSKWEHYCRTHLNGTAAIAVLKVAAD